MKVTMPDQKAETTKFENMAHRSSSSWGKREEGGCSRSHEHLSGTKVANHVDSHNTEAGEIPQWDGLECGNESGK